MTLDTVLFHVRMKAHTIQSGLAVAGLMIAPIAWLALVGSTKHSHVLDAAVKALM